MTEVISKLGTDYGVLGMSVVVLMGAFAVLARIFINDRNEFKAQVTELQNQALKSVTEEKHALLKIVEENTEAIKSNTESHKEMAEAIRIQAEAITDLENKIEGKPKTRRKQPTIKVINANA